MQKALSSTLWPVSGTDQRRSEPESRGLTERLETTDWARGGGPGRVRIAQHVAGRNSMVMPPDFQDEPPWKESAALSSARDRRHSSKTGECSNPRGG